MCVYFRISTGVISTYNKLPGSREVILDALGARGNPSEVVSRGCSVVGASAAVCFLVASRWSPRRPDGGPRCGQTRTTGNASVGPADAVPVGPLGAH